MTNARLNDYSLLHIYGKDAMTFLQGQLTCDVSLLTESNYSFGAHCNAKGRIISLFRIFKHNHDYYLLMPSDVTEAACENLKKYAVFSKVSLAIVSPETITTFPFAFEPSKQHQRDINAGIPRLYPQTIGQFLPHYLNLPQLGGVSFSKGCYTGQEIIARMEHRGSLKQELKPLILAAEPVLGEKITEPAEDVGMCVDYYREENGSFHALVIAKI